MSIREGIVCIKYEPIARHILGRFCCRAHEPFLKPSNRITSDNLHQVGKAKRESFQVLGNALQRFNFLADALARPGPRNTVSLERKAG